MARSRLEKETIITYNEAEATAVVYTFNVGMNHKLARLATEHPDQCKFIRNLSEGAVEFEIPKKWVRINPTRVLSDAQREHIAEMNSKRQS